MSLNNNQFVVFQDVNDEYAWVNYGTFKLLMMKENGYVNVTKMCDEGGKSFRFWKQNKRSIELIKLIDSNRYDGIPSDPLNTITTGENDLRGTYAHPDLVLDIACWLSGEFYLKASKIVREYFNKQERERLELILLQEKEKNKVEVNKLQYEKSELQLIREKLEKEFEKAEQERKKSDEERKRAELRYIEMCKKYDIQDTNILSLRENIIDLKESNNEINEICNSLKENNHVIISNQNELLESSKTQNDILEYIIEENNDLKEEVNDVKEKINNVSTKLGISVEDRVPKTEKTSKMEIFIMLKKNNFNKNNKKEFEYYAICGQNGYSKTKSKKMVKDENYTEVLVIEYSPNTKNLLNRLKEQMKHSITFLSNKFNTNLSTDTLTEYIREIENDKRNI
jgi:hypothetical protein